MKFSPKFIRRSLLALLAFSSFGFVTHLADDYFEISKNLTIFGQVYKEINARYVDEVNPAKLMRIGIDAMLNSLDPYTTYYSSSEIEDARVFQDGQYTGIGVNVNYNGKDSSWYVTTVLKDYPAQLAGLKMGDEVIAIDKEVIKGKKKKEDQINDLIRGQAGTNVVLTVKRLGEAEPQKITISRKEIKENSVPFADMVDEQTGMITLTRFSAESGSEVRKAFEDLKKKHPEMKGLILDLRDNPGGFLEQAVTICSAFIPNGTFVCETRGRIEGALLRYVSKEAPIDTLMPIAVLVNSRSASASEVVSGTLQDLDRAAIVGQRSFGKGLVQITRPLEYNSQIKLTTAKYYTPSGRCIQALDYSNRNPDGSVGKVPDSLKRAFKTKAGRIVYDGGGIEPDVKVEKKSYPTVARELSEQWLIFAFATEYAATHPAPDIKKFKLTDAEYQDFVNYVQKKNFSYESPLESQLEEWRKKAEKENTYDAVKSEYQGLKSKLLNNRNNELFTHKELIREQLEMEILRHYYYAEGEIQASLSNDREVKDAVELLKNKDRYKKILSK